MGTQYPVTIILMLAMELAVAAALTPSIALCIRDDKSAVDILQAAESLPGPPPPAGKERQKNNSAKTKSQLGEHHEEEGTKAE